MTQGHGEGVVLGLHPIIPLLRPVRLALLGSHRDVLPWTAFHFFDPSKGKESLTIEQKQQKLAGHTKETAEVGSPRPDSLLQGKFRTSGSLNGTEPAT